VGQALSDVSAQPACSGGEYAWIVTAGPPATCTTRWVVVEAGVVAGLPVDHPDLEI
jgi:hypothetical protein